MGLSIEIVPAAASLDMYGAPDRTSAFSLSGHVSIALSSPYSIFERRRAARILLQSLVLTFEGQTEVITEDLGYSPLRLCSISRELAPEQLLELTNEGHEDSDEPCRWNVVFDLPVPGWLPASHEFSGHGLGASTQYFLQVQMKYVVVENQRSTPWSLTTLCSPFRSRTRSLNTYTTVTIRRFVQPPTDEPITPAAINYLLDKPTVSAPSNKGLRIPPDVLSTIQVLGSVPQYVDVCDENLRFTLRIRTKDLNAADCKRLQLTMFKLDIVQTEKCRKLSDEFDQTHYPVPALEAQPPNNPLFRTHFMSDLYNMGLYSHVKDAHSTTCSYSLLAPDEPGMYQLSDTSIFKDDATKDTASWYTLETIIPFEQHIAPHPDAGSEWEGALTVRPTATGPLYEVAHELTLTDSGELATDDLRFRLPLAFGRIAPPLPSRDILSALFQSPLPDGSYPALPPLLPYAVNLPVYSQLFDSEGNRKMDATPLPLYTPRHSSDSPMDLSSLPAQPLAVELSSTT
ncbi:hypothetical protein C8J57DRAFT_1286654 [Mycena rebaudengoi]|nr:hypothetical protein C8J57DRAFT_1286654 [Mycena rebaudengoi]